MKFLSENIFSGEKIGSVIISSEYPELENVFAPASGIHPAPSLSALSSTDYYYPYLN